MATSRPLTVGVVAMALLVVSVGFEILVQRSYAVDLRTGDAWQTIGASGPADEPYRAKPLGVTEPITVGRNDTLQFRVRVDNGYPWTFSEHYYVTSNQGITVAEGELAAPSRGTGEASFSVGVARLMDAYAPPLSERRDLQTVSFNVVVGTAYMQASFQIREEA